MRKLCAITLVELVCSIRNYERVHAATRMAHMAFDMLDALGLPHGSLLLVPKEQFVFA